MIPNPFLGVVFHWLGGLASGSFYVPFKAVRRWSWETYWLVGGIFSWIICPWLLALLLTNDLGNVIRQQRLGTLGWTFFFGQLWGLGGLTYGLTIRYLGLSLGTGVALGFCAAFGTLLPPLLKQFSPSIPVAESLLQIAGSTGGRVTLSGVAICLFGILLAAFAGLAKERNVLVAKEKRALAEFSALRGLILGAFSGIMSACFAFGLTAGAPISAASVAEGTNPLWSGLPKLVVVLMGGFSINVVWCTFLNLRNGSGYQYYSPALKGEPVLPKSSHDSGAAADGSIGASVGWEIPLLRNYFFSALAGTAWYFQFFFYTMGETQMGRYGFASWTLHMASIIIFATIWGIILHEWRGAGSKAIRLIAGGITTLVLATIIIGWGTFLKAHGR